MRPLEILLAVANLVALIVLAVPVRGRARWARQSALLPLLVMGVQLLVEGPRWQMLPAYVLSGLLLVAFLFRLRPSRSGHEPGRRSPARRIAVGLGLGALGGFVLIAVLLPVILPVFNFPVPTGQYGIGTVTYHWVDNGRPEIFTPTPADHRELMAQVWYPAEKHQTSKRDPYVHDVDFSTTARKLGHLPPFFLDHLRYVVTNAQPSVAMADKGIRFPVLIFSPGRGGYRSVNTYQVEELVSHGYVVVGIDQPYSVADVAFPDGRHVPLDQRVVDFQSDGQDGPFKLAVDQVLGQDAVFALNQAATLDRSDPHGILTGRLDVDHVGVFGSSLGGITTAEACRMDRRFRACLGLDQAMPAAVVRSGLRQPIMWIVRGGTSDRTDEGWKPLATKELDTSVRSLYDRLPGDGYLVSIPKMFHSDITDFPNLMVQPFAGWAGLTGPGDWQQTHAAINAYSLAFFDKYLKGTPAPLLDGLAKQYPEVLFETRLS